MSLLPIVKWCSNKKIVGLFTRRNIIKHSSVFSLDSDKPEIVTGMRQSQTPTCRLIGNEIVAIHNLNPGDEITIKEFSKRIF